jgi:hypothetical protein
MNSGTELGSGCSLKRLLLGVFEEINRTDDQCDLTSSPETPTHFKKNVDQRGNDPSLGYTLLGRNEILPADGR